MAVDYTTIEYLRGRPYAPKGEQWDRAVAYWRTLVSDEGAKFDRVVEIDVAALKPQVTWGTSPEMVVSIEDRVPDPDREKTCQQHEHRYDQQIQGRRHGVPHHQHYQKGKSNDEIEQSRRNRCDRDDHSRKVDLGYQVSVSDQAVAAAGDRVREEGPGQQSRKREKRIRNAIRLNPSKPAKKQREDDHREERLDDGPGRSQDGLLIPEFDVAPGQEIEQFPVSPQRFQIDRRESAARADRDQRLFRLRIADCGLRPVREGIEHF